MTMNRVPTLQPVDTETRHDRASRRGLTTSRAYPTRGARAPGREGGAG